MADQLGKLRALLAALVPGNRFQARRLDAAGITPAIGDVAEFCERMPFTTKAELVADQAAHPPYGSNLTFPLERYARFCQTSGTSGRPLVILDDKDSWEWLLENWRHIYRAAGLASGERIYFAFSFGPFLGFWTAFEAAAKLGFLCIPGGGLGTSTRLRALIEHRAGVLCCTPTYALHLAEVARAESIDLHAASVRKIIVAGEPGGSVAEVRAKISSEWNGARVFDHYGMTEVGPAAYQDPNSEGCLQIIDESYLAEIIDPHGDSPVRAGETGELVLTTLGRIGAPLLRYRTGDLVRRGADGSCYSIEGGILGRSDEMIVVRGVNLFPQGIDAVVRSIPAISEYQVQVSRRGALVELLVSIESARADSVRALEAALTHAFSLRIPVRLVPPGSLPRFEFKAKRWCVDEN